MENFPFPSFNQPFYPDDGHKKTFIDYGTVSSFNIDVCDDDGQLVTTSKHRHHDTRNARLVGVHLALPILAPCKNVFTNKDFPERRHRNWSKVADFQWSLVEQINNFSRDHPDITVQSGIEFIEEELHCKPWEPDCFFSLNRIYQPHSKKRPRLNPNINLDEFCDFFISFPLMKQIGLMKEQVHALPKGLSEAFLDIPPRLLFDLLGESIEQKQNEKLYFDILQGNTLGYCKSLGSQSGDGVLFYPSGPCLEELNTSVVRLNDAENISDETREVHRKPTLLPCSKSIHVSGAIRQISAVSYDYGDMFVATRSQYNCSFFSATSTSTKSSSFQITLKPIGNLDYENQAMSLALSPFLPGEGVVAMETGQVYIWHLGKEVEKRNVPSFAPEQKWPWYQCVYASCPKCILIANPIEVDMMDLRASGSFSTNLFSVTSKQTSTLERISAVQRIPENTHHYVIATDQSLLIMDDRAIQQPVLKWRHHLQDPVHFIEIINNAIPGCEDTIIMASGSQHRGTHCFQYNWAKSDMCYTFPLSDKHRMNPPVSMVHPWKLSTYDEWPLHVPTSILPFSSVLEDRLANPLIGVCGIPVTLNEERKGLTVFQISSAGDLFYQPLIPVTEKSKSRFNQEDSRSEEPNELKIPDGDMTFLKSWIEEVVENEHSEWPLKSNMVEKDCGSSFMEMIWLEEPHEACVLCNPSVPSSYIGQDDDDELEGVCLLCGIGLKFGRQLWKSQTLNILCSQKIKPDTKEEGSINLNLVVTDAESYQDPLSKNLLQNWLSDTPLPLGYEDEGTEVLAVTSDVSNTKKEKKNEKEKNENEETDAKESSQSSTKIAEQKIVEAGKSLDSLMESLALSTLAPSEIVEPIQSFSKNDTTLPRKQVKGIKRKLNQSMGF